MFFGIRDPGSGIRDGKKPGSGIRDKHPGSATLITGTLLAATQETLQKLKKPSHRLTNIKRIFTELIRKVSSGYLQLFERNLVGPSGQRN
jgi:hypothetical protein